MPTAKNPIVQQWEVSSTTEDNKTYTVSQRQDGSYSCGCPRWKFHTPREDCKHIRSVRAGMVLAMDSFAPSALDTMKREEQERRLYDRLLGEQRRREREELTIQSQQATVDRLQRELEQARAKLAAMTGKPAPAKPPEPVMIEGEGFTVRRKFRLDEA